MAKVGLFKRRSGAKCLSVIAGATLLFYVLLAKSSAFSKSLVRFQQRVSSLNGSASRVVEEIQLREVMPNLDLSPQKLVAATIKTIVNESPKSVAKSASKPGAADVTGGSPKPVDNRAAFTSAKPLNQSVSQSRIATTTQVVSQSTVLKAQPTTVHVSRSSAASTIASPTAAVTKTTGKVSSSAASTIASPTAAVTPNVTSPIVTTITPTLTPTVTTTTHSPTSTTPVTSPAVSTPPRDSLCMDQKCSQGSCCCAVKPAVSNDPLTPNLNTVPEESSVIADFKSRNGQAGGYWEPSGCTVEHRLAIVIPFRKRESHLLIFAKHMHTYLERQKLAHIIYVVDQVDDLPFNRAMLFNVGYKEAMKERKYTCFAFHDVDNIPVDPLLSYRCGDMPFHMPARTDKWNWGLPYGGFAGGVTKQSPALLEKMNGFANRFWGWGGEDDDIVTRWRAIGHDLHRPAPPNGRYATIKINHFQSSKPNPQRFQLLQRSAGLLKQDGLSSLKYELAEKVQHALYTRLKVKLSK